MSSPSAPSMSSVPAGTWNIPAAPRALPSSAINPTLAVAQGSPGSLNVMNPVTNPVANSVTDPVTNPMTVQHPSYYVNGNLPMVGNVHGGFDPQTETISYGRGIEPDSEVNLMAVGAEAKLGIGSFMLGLVIGIIIIFVILLIVFSFRWLFFSDISTNNSTTCTSSQYYNNPGLAITNTGLRASDIMYVQNGRLFYKRVPNTDCMPGADQIVQIEYPEYCLFERGNLNNVQLDQLLDENGFPTDGTLNASLGIGRLKNRGPNATEAEYEVATWQTSVGAAPNCSPVFGAERGRPLARWDPIG